MFENIGFKFDDLVSKGLPSGSSSLSNMFGDIYEQYPDRYNFYINLLESISSSNPNAVYELFKKENLTRNQRTTLNKYIKDIKTYFSTNREALKDIEKNVIKSGAIKPIYKDTPLSDILEYKIPQPAPPGSDPIYTELQNIINTQLKEQFDRILNDPTAKLEKAKEIFIRRKKTLLSLKRLNERLKDNIYTTGHQFNINGIKTDDIATVQSGGSMFDDFKSRYLGGPGQTYKDRFNTITAADEAAAAKNLLPPDKVSSMKEGYITDDMKDAYLADPIYGPEPEKVLMTDRVIFIIATYIIRAIALFMVEWGVHTNFINTFVKGFTLYFGVYMCIFFLLVILTNAREDEYIFRMLFFYINTQSEGGKGVIRLIVHTLCVVMLIPIPFIVRDLREFEKDTMTFSEKRTILSGIEKFTLYSWILTSVVALKV